MFVHYLPDFPRVGNVNCLTICVYYDIILIVAIPPQKILIHKGEKTMNKNEIATTAQNAVPAQAATYDEFVNFLQGELGLSPLAVGEKFESDDIVKADNVTLWDYDWVDYTENAGTDKERNVHFAIWKTTIERGGKTVDGYYQGGVVLNKLATAIGSNGLQNELHQYGVKIKAEWGKTSGKNEILLVRVIK